MAFDFSIVTRKSKGQWSNAFKIIANLGFFIQTFNQI